MNSVDVVLFQSINQFAGKWPFLDSLGVFLASRLEYFLWFALFLFLVKNFRKNIFLILQAFGAAAFSRYFIAQVIRWIWYRPRPFLVMNVNQLLQYSNEASFPSGHASFYFAMSTVVYLHNKKAGIVFFAASLLITFSRVFVGIHWPTDILAGAIIGILSGKAVVYFFNKFAIAERLKIVK